MNPSKKPVSLYVHWPFCLSKCPYCDFNSHVAGKIDVDAWQQALLSELEFMAGQLVQASPARADDFQLTSIFFGGGTPSLMPPRIAKAVINRATELFGLAEDVEITAEMNPTSVETNRLDQFADAGINRVSLGVQSLEPSGLAFLERGHSVDEALAAIDAAQERFDCVSVDMIYGLPDQSPKNWAAQLTRLSHLGLSHMSCYQLTIEPGTVFHTRARQGDVLTADDDLVAELYMLTEHMLSMVGVDCYEVSNYAESGEACIHNLNYWQSGDWLAIGPGAHGRLTTPDGRLLFENRKSPDGWLSDVKTNGHGCQQTIETKRQSFEEYWMMGLRLCDGVPILAPSAFGGDQYELNSAWLDLFTDEGWLETTNDIPALLKPTFRGRLMLNGMLTRLLGDGAPNVTDPSA